MVKIVKANGEEEDFSEDKLQSSILRAGIRKEIAPEAVAHVKSKLYPRIPSSVIYEHILEYLDSSSQPFAKARFSLKHAIMDLGPTGYPFEDYIAQVLAKEGYATSVRNIVQGKCISHEIDVVAEKEGQKTMVEAKFHNSIGIKTDVHVALYTQARFEDVKEKNGFHQPLLVTNTKLTSEAITYGQCVGMDILGWSYPEGKSLRDLVEKYALYPITVLTSLPQSFRQEFLEKGIVLCKDFCLNTAYIDHLDLPQEKKQKILEESQVVCKIEASKEM